MGCTSTVLQIYSVHYLSLADASVIVFSTPVFVSLMAHVFLGERAGIVGVLTAIFTFAGVVIISRPPMLSGEPMDYNTLVSGSYCHPEYNRVKNISLAYTQSVPELETSLRP